jgi:hypothetical protein
MHRYQTPPPKPGNFDQVVRVAATAVTQAIAAKVAPDFSDEVWKQFAPDLGIAQHGKCGFCEVFVTAGSDADVEHYQPKSEIAELSDDPKDWGTPIKGSARLRGRKLTVISTGAGYYWRAYDWTNYLLSCQVCNRKWKRTLFPLIGNQPRKVPPSPDVVETAALLNPFSGPDPAEHLDFDNIGGVQPLNKSPYGWATIKTVGLHRPDLQTARLEKAQDIHELLDELLAVPQPIPARCLEILKRIQRLGQERFAHCGMVRAVFCKRSGMTWQELVQRLAASSPG